MLGFDFAVAICDGLLCVCVAVLVVDHLVWLLGFDVVADSWLV